MTATSTRACRWTDSRLPTNWTSSQLATILYLSKNAQLDDCNFHESVSLDRFEAERMLELVPPDGEFALMQYR